MNDDDILRRMKSLNDRRMRTLQALHRPPEPTTRPVPRGTARPPFDIESSISKWSAKRLDLFGRIEKATNSTVRVAAEEELAVVEKHIARLREVWARP